MVVMKAQWIVAAGRLVPGRAAQDQTRAWVYTQLDWNTDGAQRGMSFKRLCDEAHDYAQELTRSGEWGWVRLDYMWLGFGEPDLPVLFSPKDKAPKEKATKEKAPRGGLEELG